MDDREFDVDRTASQMETLETLRRTATLMITVTGFLLLVIVAFDAAIVAAICKHPQMFVKRNYFVLNVTVAELLSSLIPLLLCIAYFVGFASRFLPLLVHLPMMFMVVKIILLFCFMFTFLYDRLTTRKRLVSLLTGCWTFAVALCMTVALRCTRGGELLSACVSVTAYGPLALAILLLLTYVFSSICYCCLTETTVDDRVRFRYNSLHVLAMIVNVLCMILFGQDVGSMLVMVVEGLKCLCIVIMLMTTDVNFKRAFRNLCPSCKGNGTSAPIEYDSMDELFSDNRRDNVHS